jgi:hypothetical protein
MGKLDVEAVLARNSWFASLPAELSESILHPARIRYFQSALVLLLIVVQTARSFFAAAENNVKARSFGGGL